jgi:hypothetical protein
MIKQLLLSMLVVFGTAGYVVSEKLKPSADPIGLSEPANPGEPGVVVPMDAAADTGLDDASPNQPGPASLDAAVPGDADLDPAKPAASATTTGSLRP